MSEFDTAHIAVGSNLGERKENLESAVRAIAKLAGCSLVSRSNWRETEPVGVVDQPRFLNGVVVIETTLSPHALLDELLQIERAHGRHRSVEQRWGPRLLDLDILMVGQQVLDSESLTLPHPRMHERAFVLEPLAEIAPEVIHPVLRLTILQLLQRHHQSEEANGCLDSSTRSIDESTNHGGEQVCNVTTSS